MTTKTETTTKPTVPEDKLDAPTFVPLEKVRPNPWNPRATMDPDKINELAQSIKERGLEQPVVGRMVDIDGDAVFQLAFGHRRRAAIESLGEGWPHPGLPAFIREITDPEMFLHAMAENHDREDVDPLDTLVATRKALHEIEALTITEAAAAVHLDRSTLSNNLRVLKLPAVVLDRVKSGELSARAAREFLCLMDDDHAHAGDMDDVIVDIAQTHGGFGAPDWSTRHVRELIRNQVHRNEDEWRPLDTREDDHEDNGFNMGGGWREPTFDVAALVSGGTFTIHNIPRRKGDTGRRWTCSVKMWRAHQTAATREANKLAAARGEGPKATGTAGGPSKAAQLQARMAKDPVLARIRSAGNEVVPFDDNAERRLAKKRGETLAEGDELRALDLGKGGDLTADESRHMGTRAELTDVDRVAGNKRHQLSKSHLPDYFPDLNECLNRCTWGATYAREYSNGPITLWCVNAEHFAEKMAAGLAALRERFEADMGEADQFDQTMAAKVAEGLSPATARLIASLLARSGMKPLAPAQSAFVPMSQEAGDLTRWPPAITRAAGLLGLELNPPKRFDSFPFGNARDGYDAVRDVSDDVVPLVAAFLMVGFAMYQNGERLAEVPAELDAIVPTQRRPEARKDEVNPGNNGDKPKTRRPRKTAV